MNKFKIGVVFELEKNKAFVNSEQLRKRLRKKYDLNREELSELNTLITNYQVKTFSGSLNSCFIYPREYKRTDNHFKSKVKR